MRLAHRLSHLALQIVQQRIPAPVLGALAARRVVDAAPGLRSSIADEPYGLERFAGGFCVFADERGRRSLLAVLDEVNLAAEWLKKQALGKPR